MNAIVRGLETAGLVTRLARPGGCRREVALTARGRPVLKRRDEIVEAIEARLVEGLEPAEVEALQAALERAGNLEEPPGGGVG
jgi:DNA-binding MarR family transcriptional regulator